MSYGWKLRASPWSAPVSPPCFVGTGGTQQSCGKLSNLSKYKPKAKTVRRNDDYWSVDNSTPTVDAEIKQKALAFRQDQDWKCQIMDDLIALGPEKTIHAAVSQKCFTTDLRRYHECVCEVLNDYPALRPVKTAKMAKNALNSGAIVHPQDLYQHANVQLVAQENAQLEKTAARGRK